MACGEYTVSSYRSGTTPWPYDHKAGSEEARDTNYMEEVLPKCFRNRLRESGNYTHLLGTEILRYTGYRRIEHDRVLAHHR